MQFRRTRAGRSAIALTIAAVLAADLFTGASAATARPTKPGPAPNQPPGPTPGNPSNGQISSAEGQRAALDQQIGTLSGQIAAAQAERDRLDRAEELAEQRVALTVSKAREAEERYQRSKKAAADAVKAEATQQNRFAQYMQATYVSGEPEGLTGTLLTAPDPSALLARSSYEEYAAANQTSAIGQMQLAAVRSANTKSKAARDKSAADKARRSAEAAEQVASAAVRQKQSEQARLDATMGQKQVELTSAKAQVVQLYNQRATYTEYVRQVQAFNKYKQQVAAYNAYKAERKRAREAAAAQARARAKRHGSGGGSSGGGGGGSSYNPPRHNSPAPPSGGSWTAAKGRRAVARAKAYLGDTYAWAGGTANGPTYGVCAGDGAYNDCNIKGFDCSGLVMYAWHRNWDHYADTQYSQAGSYHPSRSRLKPGDLLFFGYRGGGSDLHHVAMYVGNKKMIEAPQSNDVIQISSIYKYSDYYGATRPLT